MSPSKGQAHRQEITRMESCWEFTMWKRKGAQCQQYSAAKVGAHMATWMCHNLQPVQSTPYCVSHSGGWTAYIFVLVELLCILHGKQTMDVTLTEAASTW